MRLIDDVALAISNQLLKLVARFFPYFKLVVILLQV